MDNTITLFSNLLSAIKYVPLKEDQDSLIQEILDPLLSEPYKTGIKLLELRDLISKNKNKNPVEFLFVKDTFDDVMSFMFILGGVTVGMMQNDDFASYDEFIVEYAKFLEKVLEIQKISISDLHNAALETSSFLKLAVMAFEFKNHKETHTIEKIYERNSTVVLSTLYLLAILDKR